MSISIESPRAPERADTDSGLDIERSPSMVGQNIVCFAKDWTGDPTSCTHVLRELAQHNRVLWLNSIATRTPKLTRGHDLSKIREKLAGFARGPVHVENDLWVYTPAVLPFHHKRLAVACNRWLLAAGVGAVIRRLGMRDPQWWTFVPTAAPYLGALRERFRVYYCTDDWTQFSTLDGQRIGEMVKTLSINANVVFATSAPLVEKLSQHNPNAHLASHGVNHSLFAQATLAGTVVPDDLAKLPAPVGFYGLIEDWLDLDLIAYLAGRHADWTIVLIGKICVDTSPLAKYSNIHFLGHRPHADLPRYCKGFSVALIPHRVNELTKHMNPIKLREYISAGLPIVSTALPEMRRFPEHCRVAGDYEEFERAIVATLREDTPDRRVQRSATMRDEVWSSKVKEIGARVMEARRRQRTAGG